MTGGRRKAWWRSRGVIGSVGGMLAAATTIVGSVLDWDSDLETGVLALVLSAVGLWGRIAANTLVSLRSPELPGVLADARDRTTEGEDEGTD